MKLRGWKIFNYEVDENVLIFVPFSSSDRED